MPRQTHLLRDFLFRLMTCAFVCGLLQSLEPWLAARPLLQWLPWDVSFRMWLGLLPGAMSDSLSIAGLLAFVWFVLDRPRQELRAWRQLDSKTRPTLVAACGVLWIASAVLTLFVYPLSLHWVRQTAAGAAAHTPVAGYRDTAVTIVDAPFLRTGPELTRSVDGSRELIGRLGRSTLTSCMPLIALVILRITPRFVFPDLGVIWLGYMALHQLSQRIAAQEPAAALVTYSAAVLVLAGSSILFVRFGASPRRARNGSALMMQLATVATMATLAALMISFGVTNWTQLIAAVLLAVATFVLPKTIQPSPARAAALVSLLSLCLIGVVHWILQRVDESWQGRVTNWQAPSLAGLDGVLSAGSSKEREIASTLLKSYKRFDLIGAGGLRALLRDNSQLARELLPYVDLKTLFALKEDLTLLARDTSREGSCSAGAALVRLNLRAPNEVSPEWSGAPYRCEVEDWMVLAAPENVVAKWKRELQSSLDDKNGGVMCGHIAALVGAGAMTPPEAARILQYRDTRALAATCLLQAVTRALRTPGHEALGAVFIDAMRTDFVYVSERDFVATFARVQPSRVSRALFHETRADELERSLAILPHVERAAAVNALAEAAATSTLEPMARLRAIRVLSSATRLSNTQLQSARALGGLLPVFVHEGLQTARISNDFGQDRTGVCEALRALANQDALSQDEVSLVFRAQRDSFGCSPHLFVRAARAMPALAIQFARTMRTFSGADEQSAAYLDFGHELPNEALAVILENSYLPGGDPVGVRVLLQLLTASRGPWPLALTVLGRPDLVPALPAGMQAGHLLKALVEVASFGSASPLLSRDINAIIRRILREVTPLDGEIVSEIAASTALEVDTTLLAANVSRRDPSALMRALKSVPGKTLLYVMACWIVFVLSEGLRAEKIAPWLRSIPAALPFVWPSDLPLDWIAAWSATSLIVLAIGASWFARPLRWLSSLPFVGISLAVFLLRRRAINHSAFAELRDRLRSRLNAARAAIHEHEYVDVAASIVTDGRISVSQNPVELAMSLLLKDEDVAVVCPGGLGKSGCPQSVVATLWPKTSAGVIHPNVSRGRPFSDRATAFRRAVLC